MSPELAATAGCVFGALQAQFGGQQVETLTDAGGKYLPEFVVTFGGRRWRVTVEAQDG